MIPRANITAWRGEAPWPDNSQVEQDLVLSRALVALFSRPAISESVAFRGGTALHKLYVTPPGRYSEDIDLVQRHAEPIGALVDEIRAVLDPWLGKPKWKAGEGRFTLVYRFETTFSPVVQMRVKVEINTREHFAVHGFIDKKFEVVNPWFSGGADIVTFQLSELLGTKLRALYQRKKGRDLYNLDVAASLPEFDVELLLQAFEKYMEFSDAMVTQAQFEVNMASKIVDPGFVSDVPPLLATGIEYDAVEAWSRVHSKIVSHLPGAPWKGSE
jgi:predicted nucleotidyltransferase component of viral defense system